MPWRVQFSFPICYADRLKFLNLPYRIITTNYKPTMKKIFFVFLALQLVSSCGLASKSVDRNGGVVMTLRFADPGATPQMRDDAAATVAARLEALKCDAAVEYVAGGESMSVSIPAATDADMCVLLATAKGRFGIHETYRTQELRDGLFEANALLKSDSGFMARFEAKFVKSYGGVTIYNEPDSISLEYPLFAVMMPNDRNEAIVGWCIKNDLALIDSVLNEVSAVRALFPRDVKFMRARNAQDLNGEHYSIYAVKVPGGDQGGITGDMVDKVKSQRGNYGHDNYEIYMEFGKEYHRRWYEMTKDNIGKSLAMTVDGVVYSCPNVVSGIEGGKTVVSGIRGEDEAKFLAAILDGGELRTDVVAENVEVVAPK